MNNIKEILKSMKNKESFEIELDDGEVILKTEISKRNNMFYRYDYLFEHKIYGDLEDKKEGWYTLDELIDELKPYHIISFEKVKFIEPSLSMKNLIINQGT